MKILTALLKQDIKASWLGDFPTSIKQITKKYVQEHILRTINDDGNDFDIKQLKADYKSLK